MNDLVFKVYTEKNRTYFFGYLSFGNLWILGIVDNIFKDFISYQGASLLLSNGPFKISVLTGQSL